MQLTEEHAKSQNRFHRSGIASKGTAIQMGAKTGRGTGFVVEHPYVLKRTLEPEYSELLDLVHSLAKTHERSISYTSLVITKLATGEKLNSHVERLNQNGVKEWQIVGIAKTWVSFYAKSLTHRVTEVVEGT
eukprot:1828629-Amphidinium_carterae.1